MSNKVTIRGKTYNLEDVSDVISIQNALVPDNWPGKKADCVRLFIAIQNMLALQLKRHLAANWKTICKSAQEEGADGGSSKIGVAFNFELDQTSPLVAAITKLKMSFSVKHGTDGKPQTHDLTQGEFFDEDMSVVFNPDSIDKEKEDAAAAAAEEKKADAAAPAGDVEKFPDGGDAPAGDAPEGGKKVAPRKRNRKKKD